MTTLPQAIYAKATKGRVSEAFHLGKAKAAFLATLVACWVLPLQAMTFYVDFEGGSDSASGTSTNAAWKHCPGDSKATGAPKTNSFAPGTVVLFKGGVAYSGSIRLTASGTPDQRIQYRGDGWGSEKAIIDGAEKLTLNWTRCGSPDDCYGNTNWSNIYYAPAPSNKTFMMSHFAGDTFMIPSQDPNPESAVNFESLDRFHVVASNQLTSTTLRDARVFVQSDPAFWVGASVVGWMSQNWVEYYAITNYEPSVNKVSLDINKAWLYDSGTCRYATGNHPYLIDMPGEYAYRNSRIYLWPPSARSLTNLFVASLTNAFWGSYPSHSQVSGFKIKRFYGPPGVAYSGSALYISGSGLGVEDIRFLNNEISLMQSLDHYAVITMLNSTNVLVQDNVISECRRSRGMVIGGANVTVTRNTLKNISATGVYYQGVANGMLSENRFIRIQGVHGNALSIYPGSILGSVDVSVTSNYIIDCPLAMTFKSSSNVTVANNLVDGCGKKVTVSEWGYMSGKFSFLSNTFVNCTDHFILGLGVSSSTNATTYTIVKNIIDGGGLPPGVSGVRETNVYVGLAWYQSEKNGWYYGPGETLNTNLASVFVDPAGGDWRVNADGPAAGMGCNLGVLKLPGPLAPRNVRLLTTPDL